MVAEWRHSGRHSDRTMDAIGRPKEAQWWYKGGRSTAQIGTQCLQLQYSLYIGAATVVPPLCDHKTDQVAIEGTEEAARLHGSFSGGTEDVQNLP